MSITLTSVSDTPEQVQEALESRGYSTQVVKTEESQGAEVSAEQPNPPGPPAPPSQEAKPASEKPPAKDPDEATDKTADVTGASTHQEKDKYGKKPAKESVQDRIDKITKARREAERNNENLKTQLEELQRKVAELETGKPKAGAEEPPPASTEKPAAAEDPEPAVADFESYEEWLKKHQQWTVRQETAPLRATIEELQKQLRESAETEAAARARQPIAEAWAQQVDQAKKAHEDFDEVLAASAEAGIEATPAMVQELLESAQGGEVAYYLASHPEECLRIAELTAVPEKPTPEQVGKAVRLAAREIALIEQRLTAPAAAATAPAAPAAPAGEKPKSPETPKPKPSAPPAPVETVGTRSAAPTGEEFREGMTQSEYREWRQRNRGRG